MSYFDYARMPRLACPTVFPELPGKPARFTLVMCASIVLLFGISTAVRGDEPATKPADENPAPRADFDGLGFSVAPKEGGKARTSFFGLVGEGYKFVFVIDRSGSMAGDGRGALRAVKAELLESLKNLDSVHQFQLIFYNHRPALMNPSGRTGGLAFATDENKRRAERFLDSIAAEGGTDHEAALKMAVRTQPDVIYFLTDADDPALDAAQLAKIRDMAAGITIHAVEFGPGPKPAGVSFLAALARQNGGGYVYVDLSKRAAGKPPEK